MLAAVQQNVRRRVLVIDDSEDVRFIRKRVLRAAGFEIIEAESGATGLRLVDSGDVDVVLLDVNLPDMTGFEVARRIRAIPRLARLPIIHVTSSRTTTADAVAGLEGGADAYLVDPVEATLLVATVRAFARARAAEVALERDAAIWKATFDAMPDGVFLVNAAGVIERVNEAGASIFGRSPRDLVGTSFRELPGIPERPCPEFELSIAQTKFAATSGSVAETSTESAGIVYVLRDVTRISSLSDQLRGSDEFLRALTASVGVGIYALDSAGRFTFANAAAEEALGWSDAELRGRDAHATIHHSRPDGSPNPASECPLRKVVETGVTVKVENDYLLRRDGTGFRATCSSTPLITDGTLRGAVVSFEDITERRRMEDALRARADELEQETRARDEFFALVSHELRTPMTSIIGWGSLLKQWLQSSGIDDEDPKEALTAIMSSAAIQDRLVADMLDLSRIVTGKLHLKKEATDLAAIAEETVGALRPAAVAKDVALTIDTGGGGGCVVWGDRARLRQVITNLAGNAIKFTGAGGRVDVQVRSDGNEAVVCVSDTGSGIAPEFLPRIFQKFVQAEAGTRAGGLGLGLAITRAIVDAHGGSISATSAGVGKGAQFVVRLPATAP